MTTEQLKELGLTEDQIREVFKLNGIAVENARQGVTELEQELETLKAEKENLEEQLETTKVKVEELNQDGISATELREKLKEYEEELVEVQETHKAKLRDLEKRQKATLVILEENPHNVEDILTLINFEDVELTDSGLHGLTPKLEEIKESKPYLFKKEKEEIFEGANPEDPGTKNNNLDVNKSYDDFLKLYE